MATAVSLPDSMGRLNSQATRRDVPALLPAQMAGCKRKTEEADGRSANKKPRFWRGFVRSSGSLRITPDDVLVPKGGLEPPRPKPLPPQGSASTNSATWAKTCGHPDRRTDAPRRRVANSTVSYLPCAGCCGCAGAGCGAGAAGTLDTGAAGCCSGAAGTAPLPAGTCCV